MKSNAGSSLIESEEMETQVPGGSAGTGTGTGMLQALISAVKSASPNGKLEIARSLGLGTPTRRTGRMLKNEEARRYALSVGEVTRPPGFVPVPPEAVSVLGEQAVAIWQQKWQEGVLTQTSEMEMLMDGLNAEQLGVASTM